MPITHTTRTLLLTSTALLAFSTGCIGSGMALRPDGSPGLQECPEESKKAMHDEEFGPFAATSRLYGQVWTSGPQVVIRYYEAQSPTGEKVPLCAVARLGYDQMRKLPESKPGTAILEGSVAAAFIVDAFR